MVEKTEQLEKTIEELKEKLAELKNIEEDLRESEELFKIIFELAPDAYFLSDLKGIFIDGNKAAEEMLGYKKEELIGKSMLKLNLVSFDQVPQIAKRLAQHALGKLTKPGDFILNRKDGTKIITEISGAMVKIKGKTIVLGIVRDITERKNTEEELINKNLELERFNKLAVGREMRNIELKNKIKELEEKLKNKQP